MEYHFSWLVIPKPKHRLAARIWNFLINSKWVTARFAVAVFATPAMMVGLGKIVIEQAGRGQSFVGLSGGDLMFVPVATEAEAARLRESWTIMSPMDRFDYLKSFKPIPKEVRKMQETEPTPTLEDKQVTETTPAPSGDKVPADPTGQESGE